MISRRMPLLGVERVDCEQGLCAVADLLEVEPEECDPTSTVPACFSTDHPSDDYLPQPTVSKVGSRVPLERVRVGQSAKSQSALWGVEQWCTMV